MSLARLLVRGLLVLLIIAGVVSAVWAVLPESRSQKVSDLGKALGYKAHCPSHIQHHNLRCNRTSCLIFRKKVLEMIIEKKRG
jgi:hypothetical protein